MPSLAKCLKKLGDSISQDNIDRVKEIAENYVDDGMTRSEAEHEAVNDVLVELRDYRKDVVKQITDAGGIAPTRGQVSDETERNKNVTKAVADKIPLLEGDTFRTTSGRETSQFPRTNYKRASMGEKNLREWLKFEAIAEAKSRNDSFNLIQFEQLDVKNWSPADGDGVNLYVFGDADGHIGGLKITDNKNVTKPVEVKKADDVKPGDTLFSLDSEPVQLTGQGDINLVETGKPVTFRYSHNKESATKIFGIPDKGSSFGRGYEPSGRYINVVSDDTKLHESERLTIGEITFNNPLVVDNDGLKWKKTLSDKYDGKTGKHLSKALIKAGYDGIITTEDGRYITEIVDLTTFDESKALYSLDDETQLSALHNLSSENLLFADEAGGLAAPSIGVVTGSMSIEGYGDITLIGTKELGDPSKVEVFDADAYTSTFPRAEYNKVKSKDAMVLVDEIRPFAEKYGDRNIIDVTFDESVNSQNPAEIINRWVRSNAIKAMYIKETTGKSVRPIVRKYPLRFEGISNHPDVIKFFKDLPEGWQKKSSNDPESNQIRKNLIKHVKTAINEKHLDRDGSDYVDMALDRMLNNDGNEVAFSRFDAMRNDQRDIGKTQVNDAPLREKLDKQLKGKEAKFQAWVSDKVMSMFGEPYVKIGRKKEPYTLDNIVEHITKGRTEGAENTMTFGAGNARAVAATQFDSIDWMRNAAKDNLAQKSELKEGRKETEKLLEEYREAVLEYYTNLNWRGEVDTWNGLDDSMKALAHWAKNYQKRGGKSALKTGLSKYDFRGVPDSVIEKGIKAGEAMLYAPVPYFEAKPQRAVGLDEFAGAVVPNDVSKDVLAVLDKHGIEYKKYGARYDEEARTKAVVSLRKKLAKNTPDVLFKSADHLQSKSKTDLTKTQAASAIAKVVENISDTLGVTVNVISSNEIPESIKKQIPAGKRPKGYVIGDTVHLVHDHLSNAKDAQITLAHELKGHVGVNNIIDNWGDIETLYAGLKKRGGKRFKSIQDEVNRRNENLDNLTEIKEFIAIAAERRETEGSIGAFMRKVREALKNALSAMGFKPIGMTDIDVILSRSEAYLKGDKYGGGLPALLPQFMVAYHGTAHTFDKFSLKAIGTGEGIQAYGWGLYFAGKKAVGEWYRDKLSGKGSQRITVNGREVTAKNDGELYWVGLEIAEYGHEDIISYADEAENLSPEVKKAVDELRAAKVEYLSKGNLFQVDIPEDNELLDWDKLLSEQSDFVKERLKLDGLYTDQPDSNVAEEIKAIILDIESNYSTLENTVTDRAPDHYRQDSEDIKAELIKVKTVIDDGGSASIAKAQRILSAISKLAGSMDNSFVERYATNDTAHQAALFRIMESADSAIGAAKDNTGQDLYKKLSIKMGSDQTASGHLNSLGIPGLRYLDGTSRNKNEDGSHNYVIWEEKSITVEAVNDELIQAENQEALLSLDGDTNLPMDLKSRMKRAVKMGFDVSKIWYHGTSEKITAFDLEKAQSRDHGYIGQGIYVASATVVADFYANSSSARTGTDPITMAVYTSANNTKQLNMMDKKRLFEEAGYVRGSTIKQFMNQFPGASKKDADDIGDAAVKEYTRILSKDAMSAGYDSVEVVDGNGEVIERVIFDPKNIRSVDAAFDPSKADSPELLFSLDDDKEKFRKLGLGPKESESLSEVINKISTENIKIALKAGKDRAAEGIFDGLIGLDIAEKKLGKGRVAGDYEGSGYVGARLATGIADVMHGVMHYGAPEWSGGVIQYQEGTHGLLDIFSDLGTDLDNWLGWMAGNRGQELMLEGRENNLTQKDIDELVALNKGKKQKFQEAKIKYNKMNKAMLDLAQEAGLINQESRSKFQSNWYVPFYRQNENDGDPSLLGPRTSRGLSHQTSGIKALRGGETATNDLMENILYNWLKLTDSSMKNMALNKIVDNLAGSDYLTDESMHWTKVTVPRAEVVKRIQADRDYAVWWADKLGFANDVSRTIDVIHAVNKLDKAGYEEMWTKVAPTDPDVIRVMINGKAKFYRVNDPSVLRAVAHIGFDGNQGWLMKGGRYFKRLLTMGITTSPDFMLRNFVRDAAHAWAINPDGFYFAKDSFTGLKAALDEDADYRAIIFSGSAFQGGYVHGTDPEAGAQIIRRALDSKGLSRNEIDSFMGSIVNTPEKMWEMTKAGWQAYRTLGDKVENSNRLATYKASLAAGKSKAQSAYEAKDLMDYSMRGNWAAMTTITDLVPFLNARLVGLNKLGRAAKDDFAGVSFAVAKIALASVALAAWNDDDERYKQLPDWEKDMYWHFWFDDHHFRMPKPFEIGFIAGTMPERMYNAWVAENQPDEKVLWAFKHGMLETLNFNPTPQAVLPLMEIWGNKSWHFESPIESMSDLGKLPKDRYNAFTSDTMVELGKATGLSPKQLSHLWKGYTGTMGAYALSGADMLVALAKDKPTQGELMATDIPVIKSFYRGKAPAYSTKYTTDIYDRLTEVNQIARSLKDMRGEAAKELYAESKDKLKHRKALKAASKMLREARKYRDSIMENKTMSASEKQAKLNKVSARINKYTAKVSELTEDAFK